MNQDAAIWTLRKLNDIFFDEGNRSELVRIKGELETFGWENFSELAWDRSTFGDLNAQNCKGPIADFLYCIGVHYFDEDGATALHWLRRLLYDVFDYCPSNELRCKCLLQISHELFREIYDCGSYPCLDDIVAIVEVQQCIYGQQKRKFFPWDIGNEENYCLGKSQLLFEGIHTEELVFVALHLLGFERASEMSALEMNRSIRNRLKRFVKVVEGDDKTAEVYDFNDLFVGQTYRSLDEMFAAALKIALDQGADFINELGRDVNFIQNYAKQISKS